MNRRDRNFANQIVCYSLKGSNLLRIIGYLLVVFAKLRGWLKQFRLPLLKL